MYHYFCCHNFILGVFQHDMVDINASKFNMKVGRALFLLMSLLGVVSERDTRRSLFKFFDFKRLFPRLYECNLSYTSDQEYACWLNLFLVKISFFYDLMLSRKYEIKRLVSFDYGNILVLPGISNVERSSLL